MNLNHRPPKIFEWLLKQITKSNQTYSVLGDYQEDYNLQIYESGKRAANWWYRREIFNSLYPFILNKIFWGILMFKNYLKIAFRNLKKHKGFSLINILGLSTGLLCTIIIMLWVNEQLNYDKFNENAENIYILNRDFFNRNGELSLHLAAAAPAITPKIREDFPEVKNIARLREFSSLFSNGENHFLEENAYFVEPDILHILTIDVIKGDIKKALSDPFNIVLTEKMSEKYFGDINSIGETITIDNDGKKENFIVSGIIKEFPFTSHIRPDFLISFNTYPSFFGEEALNSWIHNIFTTYLLVNPNSDLSLLQTKLDKIITDRHPDGLRWTRLSVQHLLDIHMDGDKSSVYIITSLAVFILLIACLNFINLSTARSVTRSKEVCIRKSIGAKRKELLNQFLGESVLVTLIALVVSVIIIAIVLPLFNNFFNSNLSISSILSLEYLIMFLCVGTLIGVITGFYPAIYLSAFNPVAVFNKNRNRGKKKISIRTILVVFQFSLAIFLIICVGILHNQMKYINEKNLGYNNKNVLLVNSSKFINENVEAVKTELLKNNSIKNITLAADVPSGSLVKFSGMQIYEQDKFSSVDFIISSIDIDVDYLRTFQINIVSGREFSEKIKSDYDESFILNEYAVSKLGWKSPNEAINKKVKYGTEEGKIIGVVKDFYFESLHKTIKPLIFRFVKEPSNQLAIKIDSKNIDSTIKYLKEKWAIYNPNFPFEYSFIDQELKNQYQFEENLKQIFMLAVLLAVFIACLGLLGLAAFTIEQKIKEIGIRKVLGANSPQIVYLISKEFGIWILLANIFSWPIAYLFMDTLLDDYAYRINISLETFIIAGILALFVAMLTVLSQAGRAVRNNPVDSLRSE